MTDEPRHIPQGPAGINPVIINDTLREAPPFRLRKKPTHILVFQEREKMYAPVPIPQYERGDLP